MNLGCPLRLLLARLRPSRSVGWVRPVRGSGMPWVTTGKEKKSGVVCEGEREKKIMRVDLPKWGVVTDLEMGLDPDSGLGGPGTWVYE